MTIQRIQHVGIGVDDLAAATAFFLELGLELQGEGSVEGGIRHSHSQSRTSTPSSLTCEPARSSLARWGATRTSIGSAASAARRG